MTAAGKSSIHRATIGEGKPPERTHFWSAWQSMCRIAVTLLFDLKAYGIQNVPMTGGVLFVANHQSFLDPVLMGSKLRRPMSYLAKSELFENRIFGGFIRRLNAFPVNQKGSATAAMKEAIRRLGEGRMLNIFPEGSRSLDGELQPIESGAALIVRRAGVPVIPVAIDGSFEAWPKWHKVFQSHPIHIAFGRPLDLRGLGTKEINRLIGDTLRDMIADLRAKRPGDWKKPLPPPGWNPNA